MDEGQVAFLIGGKSIANPTVTQIPTWDFNHAENCLNDRQSLLISKYTYVDAGKTATATLSWYVQRQDVPAAEAVSFSLALLGIFAAGTAQSGPFAGCFRLPKSGHPFMSMTSAV